MMARFAGIYIVLSFVFSTAAIAALKVPVPQVVGPYIKVISVSKPLVTSKKQNLTTLKRYYIAKWGIHRFEYGFIDYSCRAQVCEQKNEAQRIAMFEKCEGVSEKGRPLCSGLVSVQNQEIFDVIVSESRLECELNSSACQRNDDTGSDFENSRNEDDEVLF